MLSDKNSRMFPPVNHGTTPATTLPSCSTAPITAVLLVLRPPNIAPKESPNEIAQADRNLDKDNAT